MKKIEKKFNEVEIVRTKESLHLKAEIRQIRNGKGQTFFGLTIKANKIKLIDGYYTFHCEAENFAKGYLQGYERMADNIYIR